MSNKEILKPPTVSIVIPACNEEKFLEECLDSILSQTYQDFEIICIDNGSTDSTVSLIRDYIKKDNRISLLFSEGNAGDARNKGIEKAQGEYLLFLDADDFFNEILLESAISLAEQNDAEIVLYAGRRYDDSRHEFLDKSEFLNHRLFPKDSLVFSAEDISDNLFQLTTPAPWSKLFKKSFINKHGLRFQSLNNSNDLFFTLSALSLAERITGTDKELIFYRINRQGSIQSNKAKDPLCFFEALKALRARMIDEGVFELFEETFNKQLLSTIRYNLNTAATDEAKESVFEYLKKNWTSWLELNWSTEYIERFSKTAWRLRSHVVAAMRQREKMIKLNDNTDQAQDVECCNIVSTKNSNPDITIIVVAYNAAAYIDETMKSLLKQPLSDFEIICIDDGSEDNTQEMLLNWASQDERILVLRQSNMGLSMARNVGLKKAHGRYICYVDAGDMISFGALNLLFETMEKKNLDVLGFESIKYCSEDEDNIVNIVDCINDTLQTSRIHCPIYDGFSLLANLNNHGEYNPSPCLYMTRKAFLDSFNAHFLAHIDHSENAYTFEVMMRAKSTAKLNDRIYIKRKAPEANLNEVVNFFSIYGYYACIRNMFSSYFTVVGDKDYEESLDVFQVIQQLMINAQKEYAKLPEGETSGVLGLDLHQARFFKQWISDEGDVLRLLEKAEKKNEKLSNRVLSLKNRNTYLKEQLKESEKKLKHNKKPLLHKVANKLFKT